MKVRAFFHFRVESDLFSTQITYRSYVWYVLLNDDIADSPDRAARSLLAPLPPPASSWIHEFHTTSILDYSLGSPLQYCNWQSPSSDINCTGKNPSYTLHRFYNFSTGLALTLSVLHTLSHLCPGERYSKLRRRDHCCPGFITSLTSLNSPITEHYLAVQSSHLFIHHWISQLEGRDSVHKEETATPYFNLSKQSQ